MWFTLISIFHTWLALFIMSLEGELDGFMLHCISCTCCLASDDIREQKLRMALKELRGNYSVSSPLSRGRATCLKFWNWKCVRKFSSFEARPATICAGKRCPFLVAPLIPSSWFQRTFKVRGLNIQWQCTRNVALQRVFFFYRRTEACRESSHTAPMTLYCLYLRVVQ